MNNNNNGNNPNHDPSWASHPGTLPKGAFTGPNNVYSYYLQNPQMSTPSYPGWPPQEMVNRDPRLAPYPHPNAPLPQPYPPAYNFVPPPPGMPANTYVPAQVPPPHTIHGNPGAAVPADGQSYFRPGQSSHGGIREAMHSEWLDQTQHVSKTYENVLQSAYQAGAAQQNRNAYGDYRGPGRKEGMQQARRTERELLEAAKAAEKKHRKALKDASAAGVADIIGRRG
ncbi:hypothetical protein VNI00_019183 [Paramarasmius palmivorus]|uniref:Uncharacterized protein n=1 Tax=Paramarasmius palmivorus TaxID=297713 RepID=A0AAW0APE0_9AGAR